MTVFVTTPRNISQTWTFFNGSWREANQAILGPRTHGAWLGSMVFDGARAFEGVTPDLDLHLARVNRSASNMLLDPVVTQDQWWELAEDGMQRFARDAQLYIRPNVLGGRRAGRRREVRSVLDQLVSHDL